MLGASSLTFFTVFVHSVIFTFSHFYCLRIYDRKANSFRNLIIPRHELNAQLNDLDHFSREGNHADDFSRLTYRKLLEEVCRFANVLKMHGVNKGDRVSFYMPMILELPIAMLACARIGAVHSIVVS